jgi:hypothetical protein
MRLPAVHPTLLRLVGIDPQLTEAAGIGTADACPAWYREESHGHHAWHAPSDSLKRHCPGHRPLDEVQTGAWDYNFSSHSSPPYDAWDVSP